MCFYPMWTLRITVSPRAWGLNRRSVSSRGRSGRYPHGRGGEPLTEVIEHLEPFRLQAFERILFGDLSPQTIVLTTPNRDYNAAFETLPAGKMRHSDRRFEWSRDEFAEWTNHVAARNGYAVTVSGAGPHSDDHGAPSQMAVFARAAASPSSPPQRT